MKPRAKRWMLGIAAAVAVSSCGDGASTEPRVAAPAANLSSAATTEVVRLLKRTDGLGPGMSASAVIGPRGGHITLEEAGVRIEFPRGAVAVPTRITVTAVPGRNVAYQFEPHGLVFAKPVNVRQSLRHTTAWGNRELAAQLQGSYFERLLVDSSGTFARSLEARPGKLKESGRFLEFTIEHFSGYILSTGEAGVKVEVDVEVSIR